MTTIIDDRKKGKPPTFGGLCHNNWFMCGEKLFRKTSHLTAWNYTSDCASSDWNLNVTVKPVEVTIHITG